MINQSQLRYRHATSLSARDYNITKTNGGANPRYDIVWASRFGTGSDEVPYRMASMMTLKYNVLSPDRCKAAKLRDPQTIATDKFTFEYNADVHMDFVVISEFAREMLAKLQEQTMQTLKYDVYKTPIGSDMLDVTPNQSMKLQFSAKTSSGALDVVSYTVARDDTGEILRMELDKPVPQSFSSGMNALVTFRPKGIRFFTAFDTDPITGQKKKTTYLILDLELIACVSDQSHAMKPVSTGLEEIVEDFKCFDDYIRPKTKNENI